MCHEQWALTVIKLLRFFVLIDVIMKTFIRHRQKTKKEVKNDDRMRKRKIP